MFRYFRTQIAILILMFLLITPTFSVVIATEAGSKKNGKIAFVSDRDGNNEIYTMNADGSGQTRLTNNDYDDGAPGWSPNGTKIAFNTNRDGNAEIYVMNADGSEQTRLTNNNYNDANPSWSPDGSKILFSRDLDGNWEIYVMNSDGSEETRLTNNNGPWDLGASYSPDGTKILFLSHRDGDSDIYVMNPDGSGQTILTNNHSMEELATWSPDGTKIVFSSNRDGNYEIYTMNADGSGPTRLTNNNYDDYHNCWSPDGTKIAFLSYRDGNNEIYVMNTDGSGQKRLTNNNAEDVLYGSAWQSLTSAAVERRRNGVVAFQSDRDGNFQIYAMNPDGSGQTRLTHNNDKEEHPSWSPDGTKIAFSSNHDGDWEIYIMRADGTEPAKMTNRGKEGRPSWSPDGTKIAFESMRDGNLEIYVMNADGSAQTRLTHNSASDSYPRWSPDGAEIAFYSNRDGNWEIYVMNTDGSGQTRLTSNSYTDQYPSWSPDGTKIVFVSNRDGNSEIYVMNADGSGQTRLTNNNDAEGPLSWSPDGVKIAFASLRDGKWNIYTMNADGSGETKLTNNAVGPEGDWWPVWQSLPLETATLTLQSSTTSTFVDTPFNLNATLSAPKSGTVTFTWSIDGSGFNYGQNGTMTNGKYSRSFEASSPGVWAFKVLWSGDNEYEGAESNKVTVTIKSLSALAVVATASPASVYSGGTSTIRATLTSGGASVKGATVNLASSSGGVFSAVTDQGNGTYVSTYTAPDMAAQTVCTITASASKSGYQVGSGQVQVAVQPLVINIIVKGSEGAPIVGVVVASTSQPSGQAALSGNTDSSGRVTFSGVLKGAYAFKAAKSGYDDKAWTVNVVQGQVASETVTIVKQGGIPGYPLPSIALALLLAMIVLLWGKRRAAG